MVIRKMRKKWQCLVRLKGVAITQSFFSKSDSRLWGQKTEVDITNGVYLKNLKLIEMRLKDLLHLYLEKALQKSKRPKILKYDVEMLRRTSLARYTLMQLSPVKICVFRGFCCIYHSFRNIFRSSSYVELASGFEALG